MPHCPVTVVQRYRDGVCSLLFHLFFIICHSYIPLHLEEMSFYTCFTHFLTVPNAPSKTMLEYRCKKEMLIPLMQHAGIELGPHRYDATLQTSTLTCHKPHTLHNTRARGRSRRGTLSKMASFIVDSCRDQRFSLETWDWSKNDRLGSMHTSDHRRSVWYKN